MDIANSAGMSLPPSFASAARARRFAARHLHEWGCDELTEDARLIVSELVTNMVRHAPHGGYLKLMAGPDRVRITMTDHGDGDIAARRPDPHAASGRGLLIVQEVAAAWGVEQGPDDRGHTVWCDLPRTPEPRRTTRRAAAGPRRGQGVVDATPVAAPPTELNGG